MGLPDYEVRVNPVRAQGLASRRKRSPSRLIT